jgi:hypothetical protein
MRGMSNGIGEKVGNENRTLSFLSIFYFLGETIALNSGRLEHCAMSSIRSKVPDVPTTEPI